jgi:hypothetical protein
LLTPDGVSDRGEPPSPGGWLEHGYDDTMDCPEEDE